jgi:FxLD family lantipeptide
VALAVNGRRPVGRQQFTLSREEVRMQTTMASRMLTKATGDADFDLDITIVESSPVVPELVRSTSDGCGSTCESACTSCKSA